jgi:hypothetical protein
MGNFSLDANTTGNYNTAYGYAALTSNISASENTAFGNDALFENTTGAEQTAVGSQALKANTTGNSNTAVGRKALLSCTTGNTNVAVGEGALQNANASNNTACGRSAGINLSSGGDNTCVGYEAGGALTTGTNNLLLGKGAGLSSSPAEIDDDDNRIVLGNNSITHAYIKVDWTVGSDQRDKTDIQDITTGLDFVNQLKPKSFWFAKKRGSDEKHGDKKYGFLAQDILALEGSDPVVINNSDENSLKYQGSHLIPILVNAIKELSTKVTALEAG